MSCFLSATYIRSVSESPIIASELPDALRVRPFTLKMDALTRGIYANYY